MGTYLVLIASPTSDSYFPLGSITSIRCGHITLDSSVFYVATSSSQHKDLFTESGIDVVILLDGIQLTQSVHHMKLRTLYIHRHYSQQWLALPTSTWSTNSSLNLSAHTMVLGSKALTNATCIPYKFTQGLLSFTIAFISTVTPLQEPLKPPCNTVSRTLRCFSVLQWSWSDFASVDGHVPLT